MSEDEAFGATDIQCEKRRETPESAASGHAARASAQSFLSASRAGRPNHPENLLIDGLCSRTLKGHAFLLQIGMKPQRAKSNERSRMAEYRARAI